MSLHINGQKISKVYVGNQKIKQIFNGSQLVYQARLPLPATKSFPSSYTETWITGAWDANHVIYTVPEDGFYRIVVHGAGGAGAYKGTAGAGGGVSTIVFLYKGTKCLLWGALSANTTGYPAPTSALGGRGARQRSGNGESGGGGGGAAESGDSYYSRGGGGAGFLAGIDEDVEYVSHYENGWANEVNSHWDWTAGGFSVKNLYCYVLGGGGGGACSDEHSPRYSGAGGGAFGNGGNIPAGGYVGESGPGGTWGKGGDGGPWESSPGGAGAWCVMDFSRNQWSWGLGGGANPTANGYSEMYRLNPN